MAVKTGTGVVSAATSLADERVTLEDMRIQFDFNSGEGPAKRTKNDVCMDFEVGIKCRSETAAAGEAQKRGSQNNTRCKTDGTYRDVM